MSSSTTSDENLASAIGYQFLKRPIVEVTPILGKGRINRVFVVADDAVKIIVRINDIIEPAKALDGFALEKWCLEQSAAQGIPGPIVLQIGQWEDRAFMIQSHIPGDNAEDSPADKMCIWRELGRYTKLIHSIDIPEKENGRYKAPDILFGSVSVASRDEWLEQVEDGIKALSGADVLADCGVYSESQRSKIVEQFQSLNTIAFHPGLNHGDLSLKNAIVGPDGLISLLDWGSALVHLVPQYDLSQMLKNQMDRNNPNEEQILVFLNGYGVASPAAHEIVKASAHFLLFRAFGKARWAIACKHPKSRSFVAQAGTLSRQLLKA